MQLLARAVALVICCCILKVNGRYIRLNTTSARDPTKLNVHILCHSHDDAGWLKTVDEYYYGSNNTIQVAAVQFIFDTVMAALVQNKDRKFTIMEQAFFSRWWNEQSPEMQDQVRGFVANGQLHVWNGGWVQHDEAAAHYVAMIDQTTLGHRFLKENLNMIPRIGFQADPFGHSSTHTALMVGLGGQDAFLFGRADYQDVAIRKRTKEMEFVWRGAESFGSDADVFAVNLDGYWPVTGFWWYWGTDNEIMQDDPDLEDYNVEARVQDLVDRAMERFAYTRGNDIMLTMGSDFHYGNAFHWYKMLDKLIHHVNKDGRLNLFYSSPEAYVDAKASYNTAWPLKIDDMFPYADWPHAYWSGYFTSRPASKGFIRSSTAYLQVARQVDVLAGGLSLNGGPTLDRLWRAVSLTQHHDAITGTEKQHVANDYHKRLHRGLTEARALVNLALEQMMTSSSKADLQTPLEEVKPSLLQRLQQLLFGRQLLAPAIPRPRSHPPSIRQPAAVTLQQCPFLNVSACSASVSLSRFGSTWGVVLYNPLGWSVNGSLVRVPVALGAATWRVLDPDGVEVPLQLVPVSQRSYDLQQQYLKIHQLHHTESLPDHELVFLADLPALSYVLYTIAPQVAVPDVVNTSAQGFNVASDTAMLQQQAMRNMSLAEYASAAAQERTDALVSISNSRVSIDLNIDTGHVTSLTVDGETTAFQLEVLWYHSSAGNNVDWQAGGAYIFRPESLNVINAGKLAVEVVEGPVVKEIRQTYNEWVSVVIRLVDGSPDVEVEWTVGVIPMWDSIGKDVILRYSTGLNSGATFWTDSNGREMMQRTRNARPTWEWQPTEEVAGNYYPLSAAAYIQDDTAGQQLAVLVDRAEGGSSMSSGQVEVMVHRTSAKDDNRGVGEPLQEDLCGCRPVHQSCPDGCNGLTVRGVHTVVFSALPDAARRRRTAQQLLNDPPLLLVADFTSIRRDTPSRHSDHTAAVPGDTGISEAAAQQQNTSVRSAAETLDSRTSSSPGQQHEVTYVAEAWHDKSAMNDGGHLNEVDIRRSFVCRGGGLRGMLPPNLHLLTLQQLAEGQVLLRVAHLYQVGEDEELSKPAVLDLASMLPTVLTDRVRAVSELSLTANQCRDKERRTKFAAGELIGNHTGVGNVQHMWNASLQHAGLQPTLGCNVAWAAAGNDLRVVVGPMEVRTFRLQV